jgi:hypothetical protein
MGWVLVKFLEFFCFVDIISVVGFFYFFFNDNQSTRLAIWSMHINVQSIEYSKEHFIIFQEYQR